MSTRDIVNAFEEWYGAEISPTLVSRVTNTVIEQVIEWQSRPLDAVYPIVYLDCIVVKIRQDKRVINKSIFLALGINTVFPQTHIQLCIVHMVRNSLKFVSWKDYKAVTTDLKRVYRSATEDEALLELERFSEIWDGQYPQISKSWRNHWLNLNTLFSYPEDIRKEIYTTNAI